MRPILAIVVLLGGCATLGPNPATTGLSAIPQATPGAEAQLGILPGYYLSQSTTKDPKGAGISALSLALDPGHWVPGLVAGFRIFGPSGDTRGEPMLGYRRAIGRVSLGAFAFGTQGGSSQKNASYSSTRGGGELAIDVRVTRANRYAEPHVLASASVTGISADGTYCEDDNHQYGVVCPDPPAAQNLTTANVSGAYPSGTLGVALDLANHLDSIFHGARLEALAGAGMMPHVVAGQQVDARAYLTIGVAITLRAGAR